MRNIELYSRWLIIIEFEEPDDSFQWDTVAVVDKSPNTFYVSIINILYDVGLIVIFIAGCKLVISLPLQDSEQSISHPNIIIRAIGSQP